MIVPRAWIQQRDFDAAVAAVEKSLAPDVVRVRYTVGEDWDGSKPAVYFRVLLADKTASRERLLDTATHAADTIRDGIEPFEMWGVWPYFDYRLASEQARLRDPAWD